MSGDALAQSMRGPPETRANGFQVEDNVTVRVPFEPAVNGIIHNINGDKASVLTTDLEVRDVGLHHLYKR